MKVTEKTIYRLLSINKIDKNIIIDFHRKIIDINRSHNVFLYRVLSIDIKNRYSSMTDIDYYRLISVYRLTASV